MKAQNQESSSKLKLTAAFVAESLEHSIKNNQRVEFTAVVSDSRKVVKGCLFVALKGEKFDGHTFIDSAIEKGARGIVYNKDYKFKCNGTVSSFPVENTESAYRELARHWRMLFNIPVICISGSVGKTTTKEILASILKGKLQHVLKTQGSQNGFVGIPMTLLDIREEHSAAVVEVGIDEVGAMEKHLSVVIPTVSVLTSIAEEHLEKLIDIETVAVEEMKALSFVAEKGGTIVVNLDDQRIRKAAEAIKSSDIIYVSLIDDTNRHAYSFSDAQFIRGSIVGVDEVEITGFGLKNVKFKIPLLGRHNARNFLLTVAVARVLGLEVDEINSGLQTFQSAGGRSDVVKMKDGTIVLCDYYNANPASVRAGLVLLGQFAKQGTKKWACLGDMLELGTSEEKLHRDLAHSLIEEKIDHVFLYGPRMRFLLDELQKLQFKGELKHFASHEALAEELSKSIKADGVVIIKGSRGMRMEEVWNRFKEREV